VTAGLALQLAIMSLPERPRAVLLWVAGASLAAVGAALVFAGVGSMLAAAFVLIASSRDMTRSAVIQGVFPLITIALLALGIAA
jgi:hypothetical protein